MFDLKYHRLHIFHKDILHLVIQLLDHHLKDLGKQCLKNCLLWIWIFCSMNLSHMWTARLQVTEHLRASPLELFLCYQTVSYAHTGIQSLMSFHRAVVFCCVLHSHNSLVQAIPVVPTVLFLAFWNSLLISESLFIGYCVQYILTASFLILMAAFSSRLCCVPQCGHIHSLTDRSFVCL